MKRSPMKRRPRPSTPEERAWYGRVASIKQCVLCGSHGPCQVAHKNGAGMALKADYHETACLCCASPSGLGCHEKIDRYIGMTRAESEAMMDEAIRRTHKLLGVEVERES